MEAVVDLTTPATPLSDWVSSRSNQCSTTGISKGVACAVQSVRKCI